MEPEKAAEYCQTDPNSDSSEQEFSLNFTKTDEKAWIHSYISSQVKRLITHSDVETVQLSVYNEDESTYRDTTLNEFEGSDDEIIVGCVGKVPIESLKVQSSPRSQRSYANIISDQKQVNIDG